MSKFNRRIHFEEAIHTVSPACLMPFEADSVPNQATQVQKWSKNHSIGLNPKTKRRHCAILL